MKTTPSRFATAPASGSTLFRVGCVQLGALAAVGEVDDQSQAEPDREPHPGLPIETGDQLIAGLNWETWVRFAVWFGLGLIVYFAYSRKRSKLNASDAE